MDENKVTEIKEESIKVYVDAKTDNTEIKEDDQDIAVQITTPPILEVEDENIIDVAMYEAFPFITSGILDESMDDKDILIDGGVVATDDNDTIKLQEVLEDCAAQGGSGTVDHSVLNGRELSEQHPISAISGLRDELNDIETIKRIYSSESGLSEFREWNDGNPNMEDRAGYFVKLVPGTDNIDICTDKDDVYGVAVINSGFVGNQIQSDKSGDPSYSMVGIAGALRVRTDGTARNGEYVVPDATGIATFSENGCGYKVISQGSYSTYPYVTIAVTPQNDKLSKVYGMLTEADGTLGNLVIRIEDIEDRANNASQKADIIISDNESIKEILNENKQNIEQISNISNSAYEAAQEAKESVSSAVTSATEAMKKAQEAALEAQNAADDLSNAMDMINEMEPLVSFESGEYKGAAGIVAITHENQMNLGSLMQTVDEQGSNLAALMLKKDDNGTSIQSLVSHIDKYSVGQYSISYGLSKSNAQSIFVDEYIYVPTVNHTEAMYIDDNTTTEITFARGYSYIWDNENGIWTQSQEVSLASTYRDGAQDGDLWLCWQNTERLDENGEVKITYLSGTLYRWFNTDAIWIAVASVADNAQSRMLSVSTQRADEISQSILNSADEGSTVKQEMDRIISTVYKNDGYISEIEQTAESIRAGTYTESGNASQLELLVSDTNSSLNAVASGRFHVAYQSYLGDVPEVYNGGNKYNKIPTWNEELGIFVFDDTFVDNTNGIYYFYSDDSTKYCKVVYGGYEIYTIGNKATSGLNSRITTTEAILAGTALLETKDTTALSNITIAADEEGASVSSIASYYYHSLIEISKDEKIPIDDKKYSLPPVWNVGLNKYVFNVADRDNDNGTYYFIDNDEKTYCHVTTTGGEEPETLYEIYGLSSQSPSVASIVQKVDENSASIGMIVDKNGIKSGVIVEAINEHSGVKINADCIELIASDTSSSIAQYVIEKTDALKNDINSLSDNIDSKIDYYWQSTPPYTEYYNIPSSNTDYDSYVGDFWYDTNNNVTKRYTKVDAGSNVYHYVWKDQLDDTVQEDIYDKIDGKKSIYTVCPNGFYKNDVWLYEGVTNDNGLVEDETAEKEAPYYIQDGVRTYYKKNDLLIALSDSTVYNPSMWQKYSLNIAKNNNNCSIIINDEYVNINNGTINITRTDGKTKISLDPFDGIKIQKLITSNEESYWKNQLYADSNGDMILTGTITSNAGLIGGWSISENLLYAGNVGLYSANAFDTGDDLYKCKSLVSEEESYNTVRFWAGSATPEGAQIKILDDGSLYANAASITGSIYSNSGTIGGWTISSSGISNNNGLYYLNNDGSGRIGLMTFNQWNASFDGNIYAKNLQAGSQNIDGEVFDYGYIGNEHIADNSISPDKLYAEYVDGVTESIAAVQVYADETFATTSSVSTLQTEIYNELEGYVEKVGLDAAIETYVNGEEGISNIIQACSGVYQKIDDMSEYVTTNNLNVTVNEYLNSSDGIAAIDQVTSGVYATKDSLGDYVSNSQLNTKISQYINGDGKAEVISAVSSTYQTKEDMSEYATKNLLSNYVPTSQLNTQIGQYIDSATGTAKVISAASGTYQKKTDMSNYVTTSSLNTSIGQYIDSTTGKAKVVSAVSGTYQTISGMSEYAKTSAITTIEQSVSDVEAAITLSSSYSKNTIGTNVYALLQLVSNANSSSIKIKADKIDFTGFTTFLRASDLSSSGSTTIDGGRITTGTISADRIDVTSLRVKSIYGTGSYNDSTLLYSDSNKIYIGGTSTSSSRASELNMYVSQNINLFAASKITMGQFSTTAIEIYAQSSSFGYIRPCSNGAMSLGSSSNRWGGLYVENAIIGNSTYYVTFDENGNITPSSTSSGCFYIGSSSKPFQALYVKNITASGGVSILGSSLKIGNNSVATYYVNITQNSVAPSINNTSMTFKLGTSSAYWHYAYIGSSATYIGTSTSSKLGFFGTAPIARKTVSSSADVATLITALKAYGLIG